MLTRLRLENFKSWKDTGEIALKPITGFFGPNSSGKTSLFQALLLLKQSADSPDRGIVVHFGDGKTPVNLGNFESVIREHDTSQTLKFSLAWNAKDDIDVPNVYSSGVVREGEDIGFEVEIGEISVGAGESLMLEEMAYQIPGGRRFGMRRLRDSMTYDLFAHGPDFDISQRAERGSHHLRPSKFHDFPYGADRNTEDPHFLFSLAYGLELVLRDLYYLGPLRANPHRIYAWSGAQPPDMGPAGESVVDAMLSFRQQGNGVLTGAGPGLVDIDVYVAGWLKRLGLVHDFRVEALSETKRIFEVKVRKSTGSAEVLLADVGFGVSQILPVLVLCFYVPLESTVILDHPDVHLHPSAQAGLADVFIDAWKKHRVQILFESHSEHLLRRLQRRIAEEEIEQDDVGLFFCSTDGSEGSNLSQLEVDQFGNISNWPKDFFGDQFGEIAAMSDAALARQEESG